MWHPSSKPATQHSFSPAISPYPSLSLLLLQVIAFIGCVLFESRFSLCPSHFWFRHHSIEWSNPIAIFSSLPGPLHALTQCLQTVAVAIKFLYQMILYLILKVFHWQIETNAKLNLYWIIYRYMSIIIPDPSMIKYALIELHYISGKLHWNG